MFSQLFQVALFTIFCCHHLPVAELGAIKTGHRAFNAASELYKTFLALTEHPRILMSKSGEQLKYDFTASLKLSENTTSEFLQRLYHMDPLEYNGIVTDLYRDLEAHLEGTNVDVVESVELFFDRLFPLVYRYVLTDHMTKDISREAITSGAVHPAKSTASRTKLISTVPKVVPAFSSRVLPSGDCLMEIRRDLSPRPFGDAPLKLGSRLRKSLHAARAVLEGLSIGASALQTTSQITAPCSHTLEELGDCVLLNNTCEAMLSAEPRCLHRVDVVINEKWEGLVDRLTRAGQLLVREYNLIDSAMAIPTKISDAIMHSVNIAHKFYDKMLSLCVNESKDGSGGHSVNSRMSGKSSQVSSTNGKIPDEPSAANQKSPSKTIGTITAKTKATNEKRSSASDYASKAVTGEGFQLLDDNRERLSRMLDSIYASRGVYAGMTARVCELYAENWKEEQELQAVSDDVRKDCKSLASRGHDNSTTALNGTTAVLLDILQGSSSATKAFFEYRNKRQDVRQHRGWHGNDDTEEWAMMQSDQAADGSGDSRQDNSNGDYYDDDEYYDEKDYDDHGRYDHRNHGNNDNGDYEDLEGSGSSGEEDDEIDRHIISANEQQKGTGRRIDFEFEDPDSSHNHITHPPQHVTHPPPGARGGTSAAGPAYYATSALSFLLPVVVSAQYLCLFC